MVAAPRTHVRQQCQQRGMRPLGLLPAASAPYGLAFTAVRDLFSGCTTNAFQLQLAGCNKRDVHRVAMKSSPSGGNDRASDPRDPRSFTYAYCHGFLSGPTSIKGQTLREGLLEVGVDMTLLNLNGADSDPGAITTSGGLRAIREFHQEKKASTGDPGLKLRLVGSSLGGYVVSRYADLHPDEVDRIFMLCPSFCLGSRAPNLLSEEDMKKWERDGARVFPVSTGGEATVPWAFIQDAVLQPDYPGYVCPAAIVHGINDEVVPVESTRALVEGSTGLAKRTSALFVEDDHALTKPSTLSLTVKALIDFFDLGGGEDTTVSAAVKTTAADEEEKAEPQRSPVQKTVEVEAKFSTENLEKVKEAILAQGGVLVGEQVFTDEYWDAPGCGLTEKDWWLRSRAGRWELKIPAGDGGQGMTAYREITLPSEIAEELKTARFLGESETSTSNEGSLDEGILEAAGFEVFASFRTNRTKYRLGEHTIDIDRASFGHQVVEIEAMSEAEAADISAAGAGVATLARSLGISGEGGSGHPVKGKLVTFILENCPRQLEVLKRQRAEGANRSQQNV